VDFFYGKKLVLLGRLTYGKSMDLAAEGAAQVLRATTKKGRQLFLGKKCTLSASVAHPPM